MRNLVVIVIAFLIPSISFAQDSDLGNWVIFFGKKELNNNLYWHHELQYRNYELSGDLEQLLIRTGLGLELSPQADLLLGYGFIRSENYDNTDSKFTVNEHRIYQQFITKNSFGKLSMLHRYRFEQRFIEDDFKLRFRYFLALSYPIKSFGDGSRKLYLAAYDEIFLNTVDSIFDRNRLFGALGYQLNNSLKVELGYMIQKLNSLSRDQLQMALHFKW